MRNLRISHATSSNPVVSEHLKECEKIAEDLGTGCVFVATPSKLIFLDEHKEVDAEMSWEVERNGSTLVSLTYLPDSNEIAAVLDNGTMILINVDSRTIQEEGFLCAPILAAQWSPDMDTLVVVGEDMVFFFDRLLNPLVEIPLVTSEQGKEELVTVGWGSKETQFQGSVGKAARDKKEINRSAYSDDSRKPSISWRADANFVAISYFDEMESERKVAMFNCEGELLSRTKNEHPLEGGVAVRPTGNYIATTRREEDGSRSLCFFERNGEPRHVVSLAGQESSTVDVQRGKIGWDMEGNILGIQFRKEDRDYVELWTVSNYDWTRKLTIPVKGGLRDWFWTAERAGRLSLISSEGILLQIETIFEYNTDDAKAVVVATDMLRVTDISRFPIPPPMCEYTISCGNDVMLLIHGGDRLAVLRTDWTIETFTEEAGRFVSSDVRKFPSPEGSLIATCGSIGKDGQIALAIHTYQGNTVVEVDKEGSTNSRFTTPECIIWIGHASHSLVCVLSNGDVVSLSPDPVVLFPLGPLQSIRAQLCKNSLITLTPAHDLAYHGQSIGQGVSSFAVSNDALLYISLQSKLHIIDTANGMKSISNERAVELGSRLVGCATVGTNVVMQMPRGNLETIQPRPFVVKIIKKFADERKYLDALKMMKKHRIDMNLLIDHDPETFLSNLPLVVKSVPSPDLLNLFIANLSDARSEFVPEGEVMQDKVSRISTLLAEHIISLPLPRRLSLFTVMLSALLKTTPPKIHEALRHIKDHTKEMSVSDGERFSRNSLHHVGFFVDDKALFSAALATYDLQLTVQVAEASNRDPKEYLPLLNKLRKIEPDAYRRYHTDLVREDFEGALVHIAELHDKFEEAVQLIKDRNLYAHSLVVYKGSDKYQDVCHLYAEHLESKAQWKEASILYKKSNRPEKYISCLEKARMPRAFHSAALSNGRPIEEITLALKKMAITLKGSEKWEQAAEALHLLNASPFEVCEVLCRAGKWDLAVDSAGDDEKALKFLRTSLVERSERLCGEVLSRQAEMEKYTSRLAVVRANKEKRISNLKEGLETGRDLEDIDAFSEASTLSRATRRTGSSRASTTATQRKRKQIDKKKQSLKEGGEYEDAALLLALHNIYKQINTLIAEMPSLLPSLVAVDELELAGKLQNLLSSLHSLATRTLHLAWPNRLGPAYLVGPLQAIYTINNVLSFPEDGGMPASFVMEPEMCPPKLDSETQWKLQILV